MRRWLWIWGPAVAQMVVIFVLSGMPDLDRLPGGVSDLSGHFIGYALLGALLVRAVSSARWSGVTGRTAWRAWLMSAGYGVTDEYHQSFVAGRWPAVDDWLADACGAAAAIAVVTVAAAARRAKSAKRREV